MTQSGMQEIPVLETVNITKQFPKVLANSDINITLGKGEILSILGENGAGKSTLMNILYGLYRPTSGEIYLRGEKAEFSSPRDAIRRGLGMVHQHFMLVETLTVTENIILGSEPSRAGVIDYHAARNMVSRISQQYGFHVDPDERIENLSVGLQQRVEILKALYRKAEILILDEPTAVLTPQEVEELFRVIRALRDSGVSVIMITHKLDEVLAISDRVYILRRGKVAGEGLAKDLGREELANMMVGRNVVLRVGREKIVRGKEPALSVRNLCASARGSSSPLKDISLDLFPGEIAGIAGVDGNGQGELCDIITGLTAAESGTILLGEKEITSLSVKERMELGISCVPADRHRMGLVLEMNLAENMVMGRHDRKPYIKSFGRIDHAGVARCAEKLVSDFDIRTPSVAVKTSSLSGGNQQKVILAREFSRSPSALVINQPTRGLDVGAIEYIHSRIMEMKKKGCAILLVSLELEEIFALSDRILVMYEGGIVREFDPGETTEKEVGFYMTGGGSGKKKDSVTGENSSGADAALAGPEENQAGWLERLVRGAWRKRPGSFGVSGREKGE